MRTRLPPEEPAVRVLDITQNGTTTDTRTEDRSSPRSLVLAIIAALVAGLGYGFMLGRGDRPTGEIETAPATSTTAWTATTVTSAMVGSLAEHPVAFRRSVPGHDLGRGVIEYLNPNLFNTIAVDQRGMVWAGGPTGVLRLDPTTGEFDRLTDSDGTGPLDVHDLAVGPAGSVYAATRRGLSHWDGSEWAADSLLSQEVSEVAWGMLMPEVGPLAVAPDGSVWLVSHDWSDWSGTSYIHHSSAPFYGDVPTIEFDGYIQTLAIGSGGTVWAQTDAALWRYDGQWTSTSLYGWASAMTVDGDGNVWIGRDQEIVRVEGGDGTSTMVIAWYETLGLDPSPGQPEGFIRALAAGSDGSVWALAEVWEPEGPEGAGDRVESGTVLIRIEQEEISAVLLPDAFPGMWVEDMAVAPNGDLWIAFDAKLMRYDGADWEDFVLADQPPIGFIASMAVGPDGNLWLAGDGGVSTLGPDGWRYFDAAQFEALGGTEGELWVASGGDRVWVGIGCRVFEYRSSEWEIVLPLPDEPPACWLPPTVAQSDGSLWLATWGSLGSTTKVYHLTGSEWTTVGQAGFEASDLDVGPDGTPWLAGWEGLGRIEEGEWVPAVTGQGFEQLVIAQDGTVWASTRDVTSSGLWRFDDGVWEIEQHESFDSVTLALARHPDGSIWWLDRGRHGVIDLNGSPGGHHSIVEYGDLHVMTIGPDGTIWVAGEGRLYRVSPPGAVDLEVMDWSIELDGGGPGVHTIYMNAELGGLTPDQIATTSGKLIWEETVVELCRIGLDTGDGFLGVGDIFQTTEGCGANPTEMQDAFDEFGLPMEACVTISPAVADPPVSHCGPLSIEPRPAP